MSSQKKGAKAVTNPKIYSIYDGCFHIDNLINVLFYCNSTVDGVQVPRAQSIAQALLIHDWYMRNGPHALGSHADKLDKLAAVIAPQSNPVVPSANIEEQQGDAGQSQEGQRELVSDTTPVNSTSLATSIQSITLDGQSPSPADGLSSQRSVGISSSTPQPDMITPRTDPQGQGRPSEFSCLTCKEDFASIASYRVHLRSPQHRETLRLQRMGQPTGSSPGSSEGSTTATSNTWLSFVNNTPEGQSTQAVVVQDSASSTQTLQQDSTQITTGTNTQSTQSSAAPAPQREDNGIVDYKAAYTHVHAADDGDHTVRNMNRKGGSTTNNERVDADADDNDNDDNDADDHISPDLLSPPKQSHLTLTFDVEPHVETSTLLSRTSLPPGTALCVPHQHTPHLVMFLTSQLPHPLCLLPTSLATLTPVPRALASVFLTALQPSLSPTCILMCSGGHFAAALFYNGKCIRHTSFSNYTSRKKQGKAQVHHDQSGGRAQSVGAQIRRQQTSKHHEKAINVLYQWRFELNLCKQIWLYAPSSFTRALLFLRGKNRTQWETTGGGFIGHVPFHPSVAKTSALPHSPRDLEPHQRFQFLQEGFSYRSHYYSTGEQEYDDLGLNASLSSQDYREGYPQQTDAARIFSTTSKLLKISNLAPLFTLKYDSPPHPHAVSKQIKDWKRSYAAQTTHEQVMDQQQLKQFADNTDEYTQRSSGLRSDTDLSEASTSWLDSSDGNAMTDTTLLKMYTELQAIDYDYVSLPQLYKYIYKGKALASLLPTTAASIESVPRSLLSEASRTVTNPFALQTMYVDFFPGQCPSVTHDALLEAYQTESTSKLSNPFAPLLLESSMASVFPYVLQAYHPQLYSCGPLNQYAYLLHPDDPRICSIGMSVKDAKFTQIQSVQEICSTVRVLQDEK